MLPGFEAASPTELIFRPGGALLGSLAGLGSRV